MIGKTNCKPKSLEIVSWGGGYDTADFKNVRCPL